MALFHKPTDGVWTVRKLVESEVMKVDLEWCLFWGHNEPGQGGIGSHVFSQWWPHEFEVEGVKYATAEHYMMAEKARLFDDRSTLAAILVADSPGAAKALGRKVVGFEQSVWEKVRVEIVVRGSMAKFGSSAVLNGYLLGTGHEVLVEASPTDRVWGIGLSKNHPHATRPSKWPGTNLLGLSLMKTRAALANGQNLL